MPMSFAHKRSGTFFRTPLCVPLFVTLDQKRPVSHSLSWFFRCVSMEKMSVYVMLAIYCCLCMAHLMKKTS